NALIDDVVADFRETINVRFAGSKIAAFYGVMEQPVNTVAIVLIIFGRIDPALGCNRVRAPRRILEAEAFYPIPQLPQSGRSRSTGQAAANHDDRKFSPVIWTHQARMITMIAPFLSEWPRWNFWIQRPNHNCCAGLMIPSRMATGMDV